MIIYNNCLVEKCVIYCGGMEHFISIEQSHSTTLGKRNVGESSGSDDQSVVPTEATTLNKSSIVDEEVSTNVINIYIYIYISSFCLLFLLFILLFNVKKKKFHD